MAKQSMAETMILDPGEISNSKKVSQWLDKCSNIQSMHQRRAQNEFQMSPERNGQYSIKDSDLKVGDRNVASPSLNKFYLSIMPENHLNFPVSRLHMEITRDLNMENLRDYSVAFKLKTTDITRYLISDHIGIIPPKERRVIVVTLKAHTSGSHNDALVIEAAGVANAQVDDVAKLWKALPRFIVEKHTIFLTTSRVPESRLEETPNVTTKHSELVHNWSTRDMPHNFTSPVQSAGSTKWPNSAYTGNVTGNMAKELVQMEMSDTNTAGQAGNHVRNVESEYSTEKRLEILSGNWLIIDNSTQMTQLVLKNITDHTLLYKIKSKHRTRYLIERHVGVLPPADIISLTLKLQHTLTHSVAKDEIAIECLPVSLSEQTGMDLEWKQASKADISRQTVGVKIVDANDSYSMRTAGHKKNSDNEQVTGDMLPGATNDCSQTLLEKCHKTPQQNNAQNNVANILSSTENKPDYKKLLGSDVLLGPYIDILSGKLLQSAGNSKTLVVANNTTEPVAYKVHTCTVHKYRMTSHRGILDAKEVRELNVTSNIVSPSNGALFAIDSVMVKSKWDPDQQHIWESTIWEEAHRHLVAHVPSSRNCHAMGEAGQVTDPVISHNTAPYPSTHAPSIELYDGNTLSLSYVPNKGKQFCLRNPTKQNVYYKIDVTNPDNFCITDPVGVLTAERDKDIWISFKPGFETVSDNLLLINTVTLPSTDIHPYECWKEVKREAIHIQAIKIIPAVNVPEEEGIRCPTPGKNEMAHSRLSHRKTAKTDLGLPNKDSTTEPRKSKSMPAEMQGNNDQHAQAAVNIQLGYDVTVDANKMQHVTNERNTMNVVPKSIANQSRDTSSGVIVQGPYLAILSRKAFRSQNTHTAEENECWQEIVLVNITNIPVAYKIKTTNNRSYKITNHVGIIPATHSQTVTVTLRQNCMITRKDALAIESKKVKTKVNGSFKALWQQQQDFPVHTDILCIQNDGYKNGMQIRCTYDDDHYSSTAYKVESTEKTITQSSKNNAIIASNPENVQAYKSKTSYSTVQEDTMPSASHSHSRNLITDGPYLEIMKGDEINESTEPSQFLMLKNKTSGTVAYKTKTTNNNAYKITQHTGCINASEGQTIVVTLRPNFNIGPKDALAIESKRMQENGKTTDVQQAWYKDTNVPVQQNLFSMAYNIYEGLELHSNGGRTASHDDTGWNTYNSLEKISQRHLEIQPTLITLNGQNSTEHLRIVNRTQKMIAFKIKTMASKYLLSNFAGILIPHACHKIRLTRTPGSAVDENDAVVIYSTEVSQNISSNASIIWGSVKKELIQKDVIRFKPTPANQQVNTNESGDRFNDGSKHVINTPRVNDHGDVIAQGDLQNQVGAAGEHALLKKISIIGRHLKIRSPGSIYEQMRYTPRCAKIELENFTQHMVMYRIAHTDKFLLSQSTGCLLPGDGNSINVRLATGAEIAPSEGVMITSALLSEEMDLDQDEVWKAMSAECTRNEFVQAKQDAETT